MASITYWDLKRGTTPAVGDKLLIYGINYYVSSTAAWFLNNSGGGNSAVFRLFGMTDTEKMSWAKEYAKRGECYSGAFPEFSNQQDFIDFIIAIYERQLIKEGDSIIVAERQGDEDDYPYAYVVGMLEYQGRRVKIKQVLLASDIQCADKKYFNGDIHFYQIESKDRYKWHSSMFILGTLNKLLIEEELGVVRLDSSMGKLVEEKPKITSFHLYPATKEESIPPKKEVSSEGIILNKPKKHFQTKIVL